MAHYKLRFRISIKNLATGKKLTVELLPGLWRGHFSIRQDGRRDRGKHDLPGYRDLMR